MEIAYITIQFDYKHACAFALISFLSLHTFVDFYYRFVISVQIFLQHMPSKNNVEIPWIIGTLSI